MVVVSEGTLDAQNMLLIPSNYDRYSVHCHILLYFLA